MDTHSNGEEQAAEGVLARLRAAATCPPFPTVRPQVSLPSLLLSVP